MELNSVGSGGPSSFSASSVVSDTNSTKADSTSASSTPTKKLKRNEGSLASCENTAFLTDEPTFVAGPALASCLLPTQPEGTPNAKRKLHDRNLKSHLSITPKPADVKPEAHDSPTKKRKLWNDGSLESSSMNVSVLSTGQADGSGMGPARADPPGVTSGSSPTYKPGVHPFFFSVVTGRGGYKHSFGGGWRTHPIHQELLVHRALLREFPIELKLCSVHGPGNEMCLVIGILPIQTLCEFCAMFLVFYYPTNANPNLHQNLNKFDIKSSYRIPFSFFW